MKSVSQRNFIVTAAMITVALLIIALTLVGVGRTYILDEYKLSMRNSASEVARAAYAIAGSESLDSWDLKMTISSVAKATTNEVFVTDSNGTVVCCCDDDLFCSHIGKTVDGEIISTLRNSGVYQGESRLNGILDELHVVVAVPVEDTEGGEIGYVFVHVQEDDIFSTWRTFVWIVFIVFAVIFVVLMIFSFWYSKHMSQPIDQIAEASRMFARGDFSVRVKQTEDPSNELGALIDSFNKMADSLETAEQHRTEFISNVSHELRTPMTTIAGFADGILDGTIPKEDEEKYLRSIRDETRRLSRLVKNMLDVSKMKAMASDPKRRTVFDLTELILQTLLSFESRATQKDLDVDPQFPSRHILVRADKDGITQVVYNLLDNAVKFADRGSCLIVSLYTDNGKAYVSVKDRGETIPPDDLPYIFDRFHKSDRSRSIDKDGVGLGLYLVKAIINGHDEDIAVKSEDGETEFTFTLPLEEPRKK